MTITVELEGLAELAHTLDASRLTTRVTHVVREAAALGIEAAQTHHDYTDRTYKLTGDATTEIISADPYDPEFEMVWPVPYAGFVDEGTKRSKPYPFTPIAKAAAQGALEINGDTAVDEFVDG
jgi:hypothetical protein